MGYGLTANELRERAAKEPLLSARQYFPSNFSTILTLLSGDEPTRVKAHPLTAPPSIRQRPTTYSRESHCLPPFSFTISPQSLPHTIPLPCHSFSGLLRQQQEFLLNIWPRSRESMLEAGHRAGPFEARDKRVAFFVGWRDLGSNMANGQTRAAYETVLRQQEHRAMGSFNHPTPIPMPSQCNFKYLLYAGGVTGHSWSSRLKHLFLCGSVVLWVEERLSAPAYAEFWYPIVEAGVHFVPVTLGTLWQVVDELDANPDRAARIAAAGRQRIAEVLTPSFVYEYTARTMRAWHASLPASLVDDISTVDIRALNGELKQKKVEMFSEYRLAHADYRIGMMESQDLESHQTLAELGSTPPATVWPH
jgi:hypothetical protein